MITVLRREMIRIVMLILLDVIVFFKKKSSLECFIADDLQGL